MPYIKESRRQELIENIRTPENAGELNFKISHLVNQYFNQEGEITYFTINEVIGVLECAKLEVYRRIAQHFEDIKMRENGDVYSGCVFPNEKGTGKPGSEQ